MTAIGEPLLSVEDLRIDYTGQRTTINAVRGIGFTVAAGERVAVVGESGSGKSTTAAALVRLLPSAATVASGSIRFEGQDVRSLRPNPVR
jgi:peptide/nickel transport system ATP-binding protein